MGQSDNETLARKGFEDWNDRNFDELAGLYADDAEIVMVGSGTNLIGPQGARQIAEMWANGFPDGKGTIDNLVAAGDQVVVEYTGRGTHTGTLSGAAGDIPATGRSVTLELCDVLTFQNGKITSSRTYFDSASLLTQLGVMPQAGATTTA